MEHPDASTSDSVQSFGHKVAKVMLDKQSEHADARDAREATFTNNKSIMDKLDATLTRWFSEIPNQGTKTNRSQELRTLVLYSILRIDTVTSTDAITVHYTWHEDSKGQVFHRDCEITSAAKTAIEQCGHDKWSEKNIKIALEMLDASGNLDHPALVHKYTDDTNTGEADGSTVRTDQGVPRADDVTYISVSPPCPQHYPQDGTGFSTAPGRCRTVTFIPSASPDLLRTSMLLPLEGPIPTSIQGHDHVLQYAMINPDCYVQYGLLHVRL